MKLRKTNGFPVWQPLKLGAMSAANIASNLLFQWLVLTMLGPGTMSDALFAGMTLPQLFTTIISSSLTNVLVPMLSDEPREDQRRDAWTLFTYSAVLFAIFAIVLILTAGWWVPMIVPGFPAEAKLITVEITRISLIGIVFTGMSAVQTAMGFSQHKFIWADAALLLSNLLAVLLLIFFLPNYGVLAAAWISVARLLLQTLLLMPMMGKPTMPDSTRPMIRVACHRLKPILLGASYYKMDPLLDRYLLSAASTGSLSLLYMAQQLHSAAIQIIVKAFAVPAIPQLAAIYKRHDQMEFAVKFKSTLLIMLTLCVLAAITLWLVGEPLLTWGVAYGKFTTANIHELWVLLLLLSGLLIGGAMGAFSAGAFYARGDTSTPTWIGSILFTIAIILKILMFREYDVRGLAVACSIYYLSSLCVQWYILSRCVELKLPRFYK